MGLKRTALYLMLLSAATLILSGCAPLLIAGGVAGGYALAKDMEDGHFIDPPKKKGLFEK